MQERIKFVEDLQENNFVLEEYFDDEPTGFFMRKKKKQHTREDAKTAVKNIQELIRKYISYDEKEERFYVDDLKFGFLFDPENHDTILLYDTPNEYDENFQLITFELDRIFSETLEGNWLVTTYKIVVSDDTIMLYNHNENFKFEILENVLTKPINTMTLEDATILQYVLSWIAICTEFDNSEFKDKSTFIDILLDHKYDDVNFYNEYDFAQALKEITD